MSDIVRERERGKEKTLLSPSSPLRVSECPDRETDGNLSREFMSATILMLHKEKKKTRIKPTDKCTANINALLIHPICFLIAFLYTVIWHLLLSPCSVVQEPGKAWAATGPRVVMDAGPCITHRACQAA